MLLQNRCRKKGPQKRRQNDPFREIAGWKLWVSPTEMKPDWRKLEDPNTEASKDRNYNFLTWAPWDQSYIMEEGSINNLKETHGKQGKK
jgi:hypothetical protein